MAALDPSLVRSRAEFVRFARSLSEQGEGGWENRTTAAYLESLAAWVEDCPDDLPGTWSDFATALIAATTYE